MNEIYFDIDGLIEYMKWEIEQLEKRTDQSSKDMLKVYQHLLVLIDFGLYDE